MLCLANLFHQWWNFVMYCSTVLGKTQNAQKAKRARFFCWRKRQKLMRQSLCKKINQCCEPSNGFSNSGLLRDNSHTRILINDKRVLTREQFGTERNLSINTYLLSFVFSSSRFLRSPKARVLCNTAHYFLSTDALSSQKNKYSAKWQIAG